MKNKLTKKKATEFAKALCGTAKGLELTTGDIWQISIGHMKYDFWLLSGRIYCQVAVGCHCTTSYYFNISTYEPDFVFTDDVRNKARIEDSNQDRLEFLYWLRDDKGVSIPDSIVNSYA